MLAAFQLPFWVGVLTVFLVITEWADGFLARALHVQSATGARLDTIADALFYTSMLVAVAVLVPDRVRQQAVWIALAMGSYLGSWW